MERIFTSNCISALLSAKIRFVNKNNFSSTDFPRVNVLVSLYRSCNDGTTMYSLQNGHIEKEQVFVCEEREGERERAREQWPLRTRWSSLSDALVSCKTIGLLSPVLWLPGETMLLHWRKLLTLCLPITSMRLSTTAEPNLELSNNISLSSLPSPVSPSVSFCFYLSVSYGS